MRHYDHIEKYINEFNLELLDTPQPQESSFLVLRLKKTFLIFTKYNILRILFLSCLIGDNAVSRATDYFVNSTPQSSDVSSGPGFQGDFQPLNIPFEDHLVTAQDTWTLYPNNERQLMVQDPDDLFNFTTESSATGFEGLHQSLNTAQANWTLPSVQQPLVQLPEAYFIVSEDAGVVNVVAETVSTGLGPQHEEKEARPGAKVETAVQRCRRKKKENKSALLVEELYLDIELTERMKKMWELKGEIKVLSRLMMAGDGNTQMVQGWINHAAEAKR